jgi:hypothetical protein
LYALRFDGLCQLFQLPLIEDVAAVLSRLIEAADGKGLKLIAHALCVILSSTVVKYGNPLLLQLQARPKRSWDRNGSLWLSPLSFPARSSDGRASAF